MLSTLYFEGSWRVHALLDMLRQHALGAPVRPAPPVPRQLPKLVAPAPFAHARARMAEVVRTGSRPVENQEGGKPGTRGFAELSGCFFPNQVKRIVEYLRVVFPKFACELAAEDPRT